MARNKLTTLPGGNSGKKNYKAGQKNVSVYLGQRGGWLEEVLALCCLEFNCTESEFMRETLLKRLEAWKLYDPETREPNEDAIEKFRQKVEGKTSKNVLPDALDL